MQERLGNALLAELIGTFTLIFVGAGAGALGAGGLVGVAFAHGLVVLVFCYAFGHVSGNHINPAVTAGLLAAGKIDVKRAASYWFFQILGGILGALALRALLGGTQTGLGLPTLATGLNVGEAAITISPIAGMLLEALLAFFLVNTVLNAAVSGKAGNLAGLAIGLTLVFNILMGGPLTGAAFNPARYLGPAVAVGNFQNAWVYLVGPLLGAVAAGLLYKMVFEGRGKK